ncbi:MAG: hypothetical protein KGH60_04525 [Candidatus Micrarchaeota archaeon]|nr:hypothetical protein [Candidatus Micrarchaeota archaeon]
MAKNDVEILTDEKIAKGGVLAKIYFDMQSKNKDELQPLLVDLVNQRLLKEKGVVYCHGSIEEPIERDGIYITSAILNVLVEHPSVLIGIAFRYSPAGVEILKPTKSLTLQTAELQAILMDLSQISLDYSKYILEKVLKPEDMANMKAQLDARAELGKKLIDRKGDMPENNE